MSRKEISLRKLVKENEFAQQKLREDGEEPQPQDKAVEDAINKLTSDFSTIGHEVQSKLKDDAAIEDAMKKTPDIAKVATEGVKRKGRAIAEGNVPAQLNEEITVLFLASVALAMPKIIELIGKAVKYLSIAMGGKGKVGDYLMHKAEHWHHAIVKLIMKGLSLIPGFKQLPSDRQEKIAAIVHTCIIATLAVTSGTGAIEAAKHGAHAMSGIEAALAAVKAGEVGTSKFIAAAIAKLFE